MAYSGSPLFCSCILSLVFTWIVASSASVIQYPGSSFTPQQSNSFWQSGNGSFTFGFKEVATDDYLLCIWYSEDANKTAVWWANYGEDSLADGSAALNFTHAGNLELLDSKRAVVWSSNTSKLNVSSAQLLDTGNLILANNDTNSTIIWQSLDNLTDTLLLPIDNEGLTISIHHYSPGRPYFLQSRANSTSYMLGSFNLQTDAYNNLYLHQLLNRLNYDFTFWYAQMNTTGNVQIEQDSVGILYDNNNYTGDDSVRRFSLDYDGNLRVYSWGPNSTSWGVLWEGISDLCQVGSPCGAFGLCKVVNNGINCTCPPGYNAFDSHDLTQGCYSEVSFNASCSSNATAGNGGDLSYNTTMVEVDDYDYYQNDLLSNPYTVDDSTCQSLCLKNCLCMAASYKKDGSAHCYLKGNSLTGVLLEGYAYSNNNLFVKVATLVAAGGGSGKGSSKVAAAVGGGVAAAVAVVLVAAGLGWWLWRRKGISVGWMAAEKLRKEEEDDFAGGPARFTYAQLVEATKDFSVMLGEGGFGKVYKGWLAEKKEIGSGTKVVAVKLLKGGDWLEAENERQFRAEVGTLGRIHHINLVDLLGFCTDAGKRLLVYEYLEKGSLDSHVFFPAASTSTTTSTTSSSSATSATGVFTATPINAAPPLPWPTRFSITLGTARGISYLHHECHQCILHCDIKPQNILLDGDYRPKVADFGFARPFHHRNDHLTMSAVRGTRGYLAPEWLGSDEISSKADVYSFGVVLLEIARGRSHGFDKRLLCDWAFQCVSISTSATKADVDEGMGMVEVPEEEELQQQLRLLRVGLWCIQHNPSLRPTMSRVVQMLEGTIPVDDPPYPAPLPIAPNLTDSTTSDNEVYSLLSPR